jgi:hypothetical protein
MVNGLDRAHINPPNSVISFCPHFTPHKATFDCGTWESKNGDITSPPFPKIACPQEIPTNPVINPAETTESKNDPKVPNQSRRSVVPSAQSTSL